jgi:hypothetical protein
MTGGPRARRRYSSRSLTPRDGTTGSNEETAEIIVRGREKSASF